MGVKVFLNGPMDEFTLPLNAEATESLRFRSIGPGVGPQEVAMEVDEEKALELLTRPRSLTPAYFQLLDPADEERLFPGKKSEEDRTPSQQLLSNLGEENTSKTTLKANTPAVEKGAEGTAKDPVAREAQNDPRKTK
jgi:hypothetical protein